MTGRAATDVRRPHGLAAVAAPAAIAIVVALAVAPSALVGPVVAAMALLGAVAGGWRAPSAVDVTAILAIACWTLSSALSPGLASATALVCCVLVTWGVSRLPRRAARLLLAGVVALAAVVIALVAVTVVTGLAAPRSPVYPGVARWGGYPELGLLGATVLPLLAGLAVRARTYEVRISAVITGLAVAAGLASTGSRAGWLAGAAAAGAVLLPRRHARGAAGATAVLMLAVVVGGVTWSSVMRHDTVSAEVAVSARLEAWQKAAALWRERPLVGWGPGTYGSVFRNRERESAADARFHAHNQFLHLAVETGVLGTTAGLAFAWALGAATLRRGSQMAGAGLDAGLFGMFIALALRLTMDYFDPVGAGARVLMLVAVLIGLGAALHDGRPDS